MSGIFLTFVIVSVICLVLGALSHKKNNVNTRQKSEKSALDRADYHFGNDPIIRELRNQRLFNDIDQFKK